MANGCCCCCCRITLRTITIFLLWINIIFNCLEVGASLFFYDRLSFKHFFSDEVEMSMTYIFILIEVLVFFSAIFFAFMKKSTMLTFTTVLLLLESFFIIFAAVRVHYRENQSRQIWDNLFKSLISSLPDGHLKEFINGDEQCMIIASTITFYSICLLILIFKLCCSVVVNSFKSELQTTRIENILHQLVSGSKKSKSSRPTSYDIYTAITDIIDKPFY